MVCLASTGKELDAENSLRVEYWWYPGEYDVSCKLFILLENLIIVFSLKFFLREVSNASALHQKNFIKIGHRM